MQPSSTGPALTGAARAGTAQPGGMTLLHRLARAGSWDRSPAPADSAHPTGGPDRRRASRRLRPSLLLWRYRHVVVALCLGGAVLMVLSVLHPAAPPGQEALVVTRTLEAGHVLGHEDVERRGLPGEALPASGLAGQEVIGRRTAIALEPGTVLTTSMTSAALTRGLSDQERVVQVPVEVGAELAEPGARVDLVGQAPAASETGTGVPAQAAAGQTGAEGDWPDPGGVSSGSGGGQGAGTTDDSKSEAEEKREIPPPAGAPGVFAPPSHRVLSSGARVISVQSVGQADQWTSGRKVTLVTLAVPVSDATLVVGAATNGELGIVLSP